MSDESRFLLKTLKRKTCLTPPSSLSCVVFEVQRRLSQHTCEFQGCIKLQGSHEHQLTHLVSCGAAVQAHFTAWKQLYLFNYPPLRRQHISAATPTTHELMMRISSCY